MAERLRPTNLASPLFPSIFLLFFFFSSSEHLRIERKRGNNAFVKKEMRTYSLPCALIAVDTGPQTHVRERESREMNVMHHTVQQIAMGMLTTKESSNVVIPVFSPKSIPIIGTTAKTTEATLLSTLTLEKMIS